jgi:hypothetical protein
VQRCSPFERGHEALQQQTVRDPKYNNNKNNSNNKKIYLYLAATKFMTLLICAAANSYLSSVIINNTTNNNSNNNKHNNSNNNNNKLNDAWVLKLQLLWLAWLELYRHASFLFVYGHSHCCLLLTVCHEWLLLLTVLLLKATRNCHIHHLHSWLGMWSCKVAHLGLTSAAGVVVVVVVVLVVVVVAAAFVVVVVAPVMLWLAMASKSRSPALVCGVYTESYQ